MSFNRFTRGSFDCVRPLRGLTALRMTAHLLPPPSSLSGPHPRFRPAMTHGPGYQEQDSRRFRRTLVRVMLVQVVTLVLLWLMQSRYTP